MTLAMATPASFATEACADIINFAAPHNLIGNKKALSLTKMTGISLRDVFIHSRASTIATYGEATRYTCL